MHTKAAFPLSWFVAQTRSPLLEAYFELTQLKQLYRQGWLKRGVPAANCESVAEHSFGVVMLALWITPQYRPELNTDTVLRIALVHDIGEIYTGDLIPADGVSAADKYALEKAAAERVFGKLHQGADYLALWEEYEANTTPEAQWVRQLDRLEMALQARLYAAQGFIDPSEFYASAAKAVTDENLKQLFVEAAQL